MLSEVWNMVFYGPLINALAVLVSVIPGGDVGVAVIVLTLLVKTALWPLSQRSIESQIRMNQLSPELKKIKESGASREEQARRAFDLYRRHKTNPFSGCLSVLIQIPIIFALYYVFFKGINLESDLLYSFVPVPETVSMHLFGLLDIGNKSIILAVLAGVSQYLHASLLPKPPTPAEGSGSSFQEHFARSMHTQMKYFFPFIVAFIAYSVSGAVALYWTVSNIFSMGQQAYANRRKTAILASQGAADKK